MTSDPRDAVEFDELVALALAMSAPAETPSPRVRERLVARVAEDVPPVPAGFAFRFDVGGEWVPHPVPGIRMKVLSMNRAKGYATLLLDVQPGTRFPAHHHSGDEECYVISGDVNTLGRRLGPGDFLHADAGTDHGELYTEHGALVLLVVRPEDYIPGFVRSV